MAVNSKADKTGGHASTGKKTASYSSKPVPYAGPAPAAASGLVQAGAKALAARAKKELSPLADPSASIT